MHTHIDAYRPAYTQVSNIIREPHIQVGNPPCRDTCVQPYKHTQSGRHTDSQAATHMGKQTIMHGIHTYTYTKHT